MTMKDCLPRVEWLGVATGVVLFGIGGVLTLTVVGAVIGIPLLLASLELLTRSETLRGTPCAP